MPLWWNWQTRWTQNPVVVIPYRFDPDQRHHVGMDFAPFRFFFCRKISHTLRHSSFFAKRHARLACSLASALSDGSLSLPPFCELRLRREYLCGSDFPHLNGLRSIPIFLLQKISHTLRHSSFYNLNSVNFAE